MVYHSQIATLVDRATPKVDLVQLKDRSATHLTAALTHYLSNRVIADLKTLTWDRGIELADHHNLTRATGIDAFFAKIHTALGIRGTNENTNALHTPVPSKENQPEYFFTRGLVVGLQVN